MEILPFIDTNTGLIIDPATLQASIYNTLVITPRDIYGNQIEVDSLLFDAVLSDGTNTITSRLLIG